jgi:sugar phosphate isomerase/epimerase
MLESANELGAQRLSVCGEDPDRSRFVSTLAELCDLAATFGIGVDLECMAWRQVSSFPEAVPLVKEVGRPNCGALVDALHLSRTGGSPADIRAVPSNLIGSAQLCDAPAEHPESQDAIIQEARSGRLPPGCGQLAPAGVAGGTAGTYRHFCRGPNAGRGATRATRTTNLRGDKAPFRILS